MNKKDLINKITEVLSENDFRKPISTQKKVLHISDDFGNCSDFVIKKSGTGLLLTTKDVAAVLDAAIAIVEDSLKHGEELNIHGFGALGLKYRAARQTKHPDTGEVVTIDGHYIPKFEFGNRLKVAAKVYEMSLDDRGE